MGLKADLASTAALGEEMRLIVLHSIRAYPRQQIETALVATLTAAIAIMQALESFAAEASNPGSHPDRLTSVGAR